VALVTLFDEQGALDARATAEHAVRVVDQGVEAVLVAGTTGEAAALTEEEQAELVLAVVQAIDGRVPVIVGVRGEDALERAVYAVSEGADALLALSPRLHLEEYYADLATAGLPVLAYHYPKVSPPGIPIDALSHLPVDGLKDSSGDIFRLRDELAVFDRPIYTGASSLVTQAAALGCVGAFLAIANLDPGRAIAAFTGLSDPDDVLESLDVRGLKQRLHDRFGTSPVTRD
jgi:dihydrodipicolinate synthase/N-acetylneuraminate lyase